MNPTPIYPLLAGIALAIWPLAVTAQDAGPPADEGVVLQFPNNPVSDIIEVYEKLTGRSVIKRSEIFEGNTISLVTPTPVSRQDAIRLIESALQLNDFAVSKDEQTNTIRIMPEDTNQVNVHVGLPVYGNPEDLPDNDVVIEYFMRLQHIDPVEAGAMFTNHLGLNPYGRITPVISPAGLLITENSSIVRQLIQLKEVMDHPHDRAERITEFVTIEYAEASVLAQIIQATLINRPERPSAGEATFSSGGRRRNRSRDGSDEETPPQVTADDRLNRVMIVATPTDYQYILRLISEWDQPITGANQIERPLKYLYVDEVLPVLVDILQDTGVGTTALPGGGTITTRQPPQASTEASTLTGRTRSGVQVRDTETGTVSGEQDMLINPMENTAPISVSVGKTRLIADLQANSIIAMGPRESLNAITELLDKLDRKPPQVYLATVIGQLTLGDDINYGVEYLQRFKSLDSNPVTQGGTASFLTRTSLGDSIADARTNLLTQGVEALAPGLNVYGQIGESLDVFINALESTSKFKVLSRPSIYAANNKKAVITSGQRIPVPTSSLTDIDRSSGTAVRTNIEFQDVVLKLEVVPLINSDKEVTLTMAQVNDTVVGQQRVADNNVPIIGTEKLTTTVTIPNRATVVLGGLITESEDKTDDGIPIVSRIPVIGHAFKNSRSNTTRKELIVFIQPTVVQDGHDLGMASHAEDLRTKVGEEAAATFPENDTVLRDAGVEYSQEPQPSVEEPQPSVERPQPSVERPQPSAKAGRAQDDQPEKLDRWTWRNLLPKSRDSNAAAVRR